MTQKIDHRRWYYLTIDTETAGGLEHPLVYDIGGAIHDKHGNVYETFSFVIYDIFVGEKELMQTAYYADKIPQYEEALSKGERRMVRWFTAKNYIKTLCEKYSVKAIVAHNAPFDRRSTNTTQRHLTNYRYFLPYGYEMWDTLSMARCTILTLKKYQEWAQEYDYLCKNGKPRATAEILYRYLTDDEFFVESHTALEDVLIEMKIFVECMKRKPTHKMPKSWEKS